MNYKNAFYVLLIIIATTGVTYYVVDKDDANSDKNNETSQKQVDTAQTQTTEPEQIKSSGAKEDYSNKGLSKFPDSVLSKTSITELDLSGNNLSGALPGEIRFLSKLEILNVSDNNMTGIPAEIGQLTNLRVLNYANNGITGLPNELGNLNKLEIFDLRGNNPSQQDLEGIRANLPSTTQILL